MFDIFVDIFFKITFLFSTKFSSDYLDNPVSLYHQPNPHCRQIRCLPIRPTMIRIRYVFAKWKRTEYIYLILILIPILIYNFQTEIILNIIWIICICKLKSYITNIFRFYNLNKWEYFLCDLFIMTKISLINSADTAATNLFAVAGRLSIHHAHVISM